MGQKELLKSIAKLLGKVGVKYMVTGAWSVIYYGRVRVSHDIDFVVDMDLENITRLVNEFKAMNNQLLWQTEALEESVRLKNMFTVLYLPTMDKIDFWILKNEEYDRERFSRRVKVNAWGEVLYISSPEDTVLQKLIWYKQSKLEKHFIDAAFVWQIQGSDLDKKYIKDWAQKLEVEKYLSELDGIDIEEHY